jgi:hypothetical protein
LLTLNWNAFLLHFIDKRQESHQVDHPFSDEDPSCFVGSYLLCPP